MSIKHEGKRTTQEHAAIWRSFFKSLLSDDRKIFHQLGASLFIQLISFWYPVQQLCVLYPVYHTRFKAFKGISRSINMIPKICFPSSKSVSPQVVLCMSGNLVLTLNVLFYAWVLLISSHHGLFLCMHQSWLKLKMEKDDNAICSKRCVPDLPIKCRSWKGSRNKIRLRTVR